MLAVSGDVLLDEFVFSRWRRSGDRAAAERALQPFLRESRSPRAGRRARCRWKSRCARPSAPESSVARLPAAPRRERAAADAAHAGVEAPDAGLERGPGIGDAAMPRVSCRWIASRSGAIASSEHAHASEALMQARPKHDGVGDPTISPRARCPHALRELRSTSASGVCPQANGSRRLRPRRRACAGPSLAPRPASFADLGGYSSAKPMLMLRWFMVSVAESTTRSRPRRPHARAPGP